MYFGAWMPKWHRVSHPHKTHGVRTSSFSFIVFYRILSIFIDFHRFWWIFTYSAWQLLRSIVFMGSSSSPPALHTLHHTHTYVYVYVRTYISKLWDHTDYAFAWHDQKFSLNLSMIIMAQVFELNELSLTRCLYFYCRTFALRNRSSVKRLRKFELDRHVVSNTVCAITATRSAETWSASETWGVGSTHCITTEVTITPEVEITPEVNITSFFAWAVAVAASVPSHAAGLTIIDGAIAVAIAVATPAPHPPSAAAASACRWWASTCGGASTLERSRDTAVWDVAAKTKKPTSKKNTGAKQQQDYAEHWKKGESLVWGDVTSGSPEKFRTSWRTPKKKKRRNQGCGAWEAGHLRDVLTKWARCNVPAMLSCSFMQVMPIQSWRVSGMQDTNRRPASNRTGLMMNCRSEVASQTLQRRALLTVARNKRGPAPCGPQQSTFWQLIGQAFGQACSQDMPFIQDKPSLGAWPFFTCNWLN